MAGNSGFLSRCMGNSGNPLGCIKGVKPPFKFQEGTRDCPRGTAGEKSLISRSGGISRCFLSSAGGFGFLSSCNRELSEPLVLPQESQIYFRVVSGSMVLLLRHCRKIGSHLTLKGESRGFSRVAAGRLCSSPVATGIFGNLLSCLREVRPPFKLRGKTQDSFQVAAEK